MKKRMILMVALGISFAPVVLAGISRPDRALDAEKVEGTGEQSFEMTLSRMPGAVGCNLEGSKTPSGHRFEEGRSRLSRSSSARSAR